jgi:diguanylate cyclase (GGDEF)-like protein
LILYLCVLSLVNVGAGFAVATVLGRRYQKILARRELVSLPMSLGPADSVPAPVSAQPATPEQPAAARAAPIGPLPKSPAHLVVVDLHGRVAAFGAKLAEADEQLRQSAVTPDLGKIESVLSGIQNTARNFVESREAAQHRLADLTRSDGAWEGIRHELDVAGQMQDAEIEAACGEITAFNYESDLAGGARKLLGCTHRLLHSTDVLRDGLAKALADVARQENSPPQTTDRSDPLTGCLNRAGIEADLGAWWTGVADHSRLCVAMIDIDGLAETNSRFGYRAGNEILKAIGKLLEADRAENVHVARFSGQRFLLMFSDVDTASATGTVERYRQTIAKASFEHQDTHIGVTVSCALARSGADDSPSSLLLRTEAVLREAKRYGRNRTFLCEGKYPKPVAPSEMAIEPIKISV